MRLVIRYISLPDAIPLSRLENVVPTALVVAPEAELHVQPNDHIYLLAVPSVNYITVSSIDGKVEVYSYKGDCADH